ncbi:DUF3427 domain-containing protein [Gordonia sp. (in: high G+C Gram-positive bacteria)]|uniref:DUF3427 domain-containing protein n=2 Tax=unclassified Gordonia (in: high G+C Gram-positive bacteria) TaxID=2657482 RepID=UPI003526CB7C
MDEGIYELLVTQGVDAGLAASRLKHQIETIDKADQPHILARHIGEVVAQRLSEIREPEDRVALANAILQIATGPGAFVVDPPQQLLRVHRESAPGVIDRTATRPSTPLSEVALLTNGNGEPSIGHELPAEIASADSVDLVCAFIKWSGVRLLEEQLRDLTRAGKRFRVITTTYLGSTERATLDRLINHYGAEVRVQYDAQRTRLHAKAWMFHRRSGFDTAYIGSSNLSNAALVDGVEWNVRLSRTATPSVLDHFGSTFETYWNDPAFEEYTPARDRDRLDDALAAAGTAQQRGVTLNISGLEVRPFPYQQAMLEEIWAEREVHDRHWNLVVAATGTGKTVLAALDYRHLAAGQRPRLLFVAHRREILQQALRTFREVLNDGDFGELYVAGSRPERWDHVFASVQSLTSYGVHTIPADHFAVVTIDEFHHAEASTYRKLLDHLKPTELLGLTATPERADGVDVRQLFGGRIATELRLWDALDAQLLCPFHYFGISDQTDLTAIEWRRGAYDVTQLEQLYTGSDARVRVILKALEDKIVDPQGIRALGFCVSVAHAQFMADRFSAAGIRSEAVHGDTPTARRTDALRGLREGTIKVLFSVDVFNEGVDLPDVDTILMLRPTESATVFLQQLGRGLRSTPSKPVLTVLDFVGHQREEFRWDRRLRAMTGLSRGNLIPNVVDDFPFLPSGCRIVLDEQTQASVVSSLKRQLMMRWPDMVSELRGLGDVSLREYLDDTGLSLTDVLKSGRSWSRLRRDAAIDTTTSSPLEEKLLKRVRAFAHIADLVREEALRRILGATDIEYEQLSAFDQAIARMVYFSFFPAANEFDNYSDALRAIRASRSACEEILTVVAMNCDASRQSTIALDGDLADVPLQIHARYNREEILAALGTASFDSKPAHFQEGVKYVPERNVDALLVTLTKTDGGFSPTTMYRDYPISRTLFHWETQSRTTTSSPVGQRYLSGASTVLLFVRQEKQDELGPEPYLFLGPAKLVDHQGNRPIAITWKLRHEMPTEFFNNSKIAAS